MLDAECLSLICSLRPACLKTKAPPTVATKELEELRRKYRSAYTLYMHCVGDVADASQRGTPLSPEIKAAEEKAFDELASARQAVLDALDAQAKKTV